MLGGGGPPTGRVVFAEVEDVGRRRLVLLLLWVLGRPLHAVVLLPIHTRLPEGWCVCKGLKPEGRGRSAKGREGLPEIDSGRGRALLVLGATNNKAGGEGRSTLLKSWADSLLLFFLAPVTNRPASVLNAEERGELAKTGCCCTSNHQYD